jgi:hypothetical protein
MINQYVTVIAAGIAAIQSPGMVSVHNLLLAL